MEKKMENIIAQFVINGFANIVENQNDVSEILNVVERLDKKEKTMVVLYSEGYSYKEIAEITGRNFNSVGKTLSRIMEKIKKQLQ